MALRFCDSFDHYGSSDWAAKWDGTFNLHLYVGGSGRFGTNCGHCVNAGTGANDSRNGAYKRFPGAGDSTWTVGFALKMAGVSNGQPVLIMGLYENGVGFHTGVWVDSSGRLLVRRNITTLETTTYIPQIGEFVYIEFQSTIHDSAGSYELRADTTTIASGSGVDTRNGGTGTVDLIDFAGGVNSGDGAACSFYFDDVYMLDSADSGVAGAPNNDFLGDVRVEALFPNGNGNSSQLVGSDGNSTNNYLLVDEATPNGDTDYVESATVGDKDTYAYGDPSSASGTVFGVQVLPYAKKTDAGTRRIVSVARLSSTEVDSSDKTLTDSYSYFPDVREAKPGGGGWTLSDVSSAEFGVKVSA